MKTHLLLALGIATGSTTLATPSYGLSCTNTATCVQIDYSLSGSVFQPDLGTVPISGSSTLEYRATGATDVQPGPVHLISLNESITINFDFGGGNRLTGAGNIDATASQQGTLINPGAARPNGALLFGNLTALSTGFLHCFEGTPGVCAAAGLVASVADTFSNMTTAVFDLIGTPGNPISAARFNGQHTFTFVSTGATGTIATTVFTEVGRTFVPEPATGSLLGLGLLGLVAVGRSCTSRQRRQSASAAGPSGSSCAR